MSLSVLSIIYLIGSVTFIIGLKMLSHPATARKGNLIAAGGMTLAILGTIFLYENNGERLHNHGSHSRRRHDAGYTGHYLPV